MPPMTKEEAEQRLRELSIEVKQVEDLLKMYDIEEQKQKRIEFNKIKCTCGHEFGNHGKSFSVNYAAGVCELCKCCHFIQSLTSNVVCNAVRNSI